MIAQELAGTTASESRPVSDPHPFSARMRRAGPDQQPGAARWLDRHTIRRCSRGASANGDIFERGPSKSISGSPATEGSRRRVSCESWLSPRTTRTMVSTDGSEHRRLRHRVDQDFAPRRLAELEPHLQEATERYLAGACESGDYDGINERGSSIAGDGDRGAARGNRLSGGTI